MRAPPGNERPYDFFAFYVNSREDSVSRIQKKTLRPVRFQHSPAGEILIYDFDI
jgi:hypothetical protein